MATLDPNAIPIPVSKMTQPYCDFKPKNVKRDPGMTEYEAATYIQAAFKAHVSRAALEGL